MSDRTSKHLNWESARADSMSNALKLKDRPFVAQCIYMRSGKWLVAELTLMYVCMYVGPDSENVCLHRQNHV